MLSYVIVQLRSNRAVAVMAAILAKSSTDASVRYTEISITETKLLKKKHIIYKTVFKSDMC